MNENDPDKKRSAHIRNLVADRKHEETIRSKIVSSEIVKLLTHDHMKAKTLYKPDEVEQRQKTDLLFPATTNQLTHNKE